MLKRLFVGITLLLLLVGVLGLLQATLRRRKQAAFVTAVRLKARHYRDSTFLAMHVDTLRRYSQAICLRFHNEPLLSIGQSVKRLPAAFEYRTNLEFEQFGDPYMQEYVSFDTYYGAANGDTGPNGSLWMMTNDKGQIFGLHSSWVIASVLDKKEQLIASQEITKWLPCLRGQLDFEHHKVVVLEGKEFDEVIEMIPANDSTWGQLDYEVKLKSLPKATR
jgi:hypothetical protein